MEIKNCISFQKRHKDHLGGNRVVADARGDVQPYKFNFSVKREERKHVFSSEREKNRPKVNGKELDKMHGLRCYSKFIRFGNNDIFV